MGGRRLHTKPLFQLAGVRTVAEHTRVASPLPGKSFKQTLVTYTTRRGYFRFYPTLQDDTNDEKEKKTQTALFCPYHYEDVESSLVYLG